jgi:hypothetical protein
MKKLMFLRETISSKDRQSTARIFVLSSLSGLISFLNSNLMIRPNWEILKLGNLIMCTFCIIQFWSNSIRKSLMLARLLISSKLEEVPLAPKIKSKPVGSLLNATYLKFFQPLLNCFTKKLFVIFTHTVWTNSKDRSITFWYMFFRPVLPCN